MVEPPIQTNSSPPKTNSKRCLKCRLQNSPRFEKRHFIFQSHSSFLLSRATWDPFPNHLSMACTRGVILTTDHLTVRSHPSSVPAADIRGQHGTEQITQIEKKTSSSQPSSGWWLNQPIWKICSSNWKSSPIFGGENKKYLKPPPSHYCVPSYSSHIPSQSLTTKGPWKMMGLEDDPASYWVPAKLSGSFVLRNTWGRVTSWSPSHLANASLK